MFQHHLSRRTMVRLLNNHFQQHKLALDRHNFTWDTKCSFYQNTVALIFKIGNKWFKLSLGPDSGLNLRQVSGIKYLSQMSTYHLA